MDNGFHKTYDAVIAGGGIAGICAALAAGRSGLKTALIEKQNLLGGLATSGLISIYFPLCDGNGRQVTYGIAEELLLASLKYSPFDLSSPWNGRGKETAKKSRYMCQFSPAALILAADEMLEDASVDIWLDTLITDVEVNEEKKLTAVTGINVSGKIIFHAGNFIDATGDGSLVRYADGKLIYGNNRQSFWFIEKYDKVSSFCFSGDVKLTSLPEDPRKIPGNFSYNGRTVTEFSRNNWKKLRDHYQKYYSEKKEDRHSHFPMFLPAMPQFRTIAKITGRDTVLYKSVNTYMASSVGLCADWRYPGRVFETPYEALIPSDLKGIITAGRIISCDDKAWEVFRVIPAAAMTGEVAGTAIALAKKNAVDVEKVSVNELRQLLAENGFIFHIRNL